MKHFASFSFAFMTYQRQRVEYPWYLRDLFYLLLLGVGGGQNTVDCAACFIQKWGVSPWICDVNCSGDNIEEYGK